MGILDFLNTASSPEDEITEEERETKFRRRDGTITFTDGTVDKVEFDKRRDDNGTVNLYTYNAENWYVSGSGIYSATKSGSWNTYPIKNIKKFTVHNSTDMRIVVNGKWRKSWKSVDGLPFPEYSIEEVYSEQIEVVE